VDEAERRRTPSAWMMLDLVLALRQVVFLAWVIFQERKVGHSSVRIRACSFDSVVLDVHAIVEKVVRVKFNNLPRWICLHFKTHLGITHRISVLTVVMGYRDGTLAARPCTYTFDNKGACMAGFRFGCESL
jgi:hypothetical protein